MRFAAVLALAAVASLSGCGDKKPAANGEDPRYEGLETAIRGWRLDIVKNDLSCHRIVGDKGCSEFEVACKSERTIAPAERAQGVTAKVVAGMRWLAWDARSGAQRPVAQFAQFTHTGGAWSRSGRLNGNLATCETYGAAPI